MSHSSDEQAKVFRDISEMTIDRVIGLFEVVEAVGSGRPIARMFLVTTATTIYLAKFALGSKRITARRIGNAAEQAAALKQETELRDAGIDMFASCGMAAVTTVGAVIAGAPTGGAAWVLLLARGLVAWTGCAIAVEKYYQLKSGKRPWAESSSGQTAVFIVKTGEVLFVTRDLAKSAAAGLGKRAIEGVSDDIVRGFAWAKTVIQAGDLALKSDNLIKAGVELADEAALVATMAKHVSREIGQEIQRQLKIPVYRDWCGPKFGINTSSDLIDSVVTFDYTCYPQSHKFYCEADRELLHTLWSLPPEMLLRRSRIARWNVINWYEYVQSFQTQLIQIPTPYLDSCTMRGSPFH